MPRTFDGADFDIHELEEPIEVKLVAGKEIIKGAVLEDLKTAIRSVKGKKKKKSLIIAITSNMVLPGLGSVYLKRTFVGLAIVALNLFFLILGFSFFNILTNSFIYWPEAGFYSTGNVYFAFYAIEQPLLVPPEFTLAIFFSLAATAAAWLHLIFTLKKEAHNFEVIS